MKKSTFHNDQFTLRILRRLAQHTISNPIKIPALAAEFNLNEREIKRRLYELVDLGYKIGSSKSKPMGVFLARDPSEIYETAKRMGDEALRYWIRRKKLLDWSGMNLTIWEQLTDIPREAEEEMESEMASNGSESGSSSEAKGGLSPQLSARSEFLSAGIL